MHIFSHKDIEPIQQWYTERGLPVPSEDKFPSIGYVVKDIAAGFLYKTDSSICFLDGYISNPLSTKEERLLAFDEITEALLMEIQGNADFKVVLAYIKHPNIESMARHWGFDKRGYYSLFVKEID